MKSLEGVVYLLLQEWRLKWVIVSLILLFPFGVYSQDWYTSVKVTDSEGRINLTKSGEIGMNIWNISVETGHIVMLGFEQLDLRCYSNSEIPNYCDCVRLEVYDGAKIIYQGCAYSSLRGLLLSSNNTLDIVFTGKQARENMKYFTAIYKSFLAESVNRSCGGNITGLEGIIVPPGFPSNYSNLLICEWTIKVANPSDRIQLVIQEYDIEQSYSCNFDYLEVYDGNTASSSLLGRYCGKLVSNDYIHLISATVSLFVRFVSNWNVTGLGFEAKWKTGDTYVHLTKPESLIHFSNPRQHCHHGVCTWNITVPEGNTVQLDISDYRMRCYRNFMYNPCGCSALEVYDGTHNESLIKRVCHTDNEPGMKSSTNNMIIVLKNYQENLDGYWTVSYKTVNSSNVCSAFLDNNGVFRSPFYPSNYPNSTDCSYTIHVYNPGYQIILNFTDMRLQDAQNSQCNTDYVQINSMYCGSSLPGQVIANRTTTVHFHSDASVTKTGFQLAYKVRTFECGNSITTDPHGTITSPGYPNAYPNTINCSWTILVEPDHVVRLVFDNMQMGDNYEADSCIQNSAAYMEIYDEAFNGNKTMLDTYCGTAVPGTIISTTNNVTVKFTSLYNYYQYTGFSISFSALANSSVFRACGGKLNGSSGTISSPNYPQNYPNNTVCEWIINGTAGYPMRISFSNFSLEYSSYCQKDAVEVRDGPNKHSHLLNRLCNSQIPTDTVSSGSQVYFKFYSDGMSSFRGFNATWFSVCDQTSSAYSSSDTFHFPIYSGEYPGKVQCTYVIQEYYQHNYVVRLSFTDFYLGNDSSDCQQSYIEVKDGGSENSPLLGSRYCGNSTPPVLTSTKTAVLIRFVTNGSQSDRFRVSFTREQVCGQAVLTGSEGNFTSPFYPSNYPLGVTCTWTITPDSNSTVALTFNDFLLEEPPCYCPYDSVHVYEKGVPVALIPTICPPTTAPGQYCSYTSVVRTILTKVPGNPLKVEFKSDSSRTFRGFAASYVTYNQFTDLYPFGPEYGDTLLKPIDGQVEKVEIETGFPVASKVQYFAYVANKGLVTFGEPDTGKDFKVKANKMMVCPYNTDIGANITRGGVYYHLYENNSFVLNKASEEVREFKDLHDYNASIVLLVTWDRVAHVKSSNPDQEQATIQLALISNGIQSFALVSYRTGAMNWAHVRGEPLAIGVANGNPQDVVHSIYDGSSKAFTLMDKVIGNTGRRGIWIYDVGNSYSGNQVCQDWFNRNLPLNISRQEGFKRLPQCPCNKQFLRGMWLWSHNLDDYRVECYRLNFGSSRLMGPHGKECCYLQSGGQYISDGRFAGSATAYNPEIQNREYLIEDREAHDLCCYNTTKSEYCQMFHMLRPIGECIRRFPFGTSISWGVPHIKTLDGHEYTFSGWGEYTMVTLKTPTVNFTLQGRTGLAETENGTLVNATVFKGFGAEENGIRVSVELDSNTNNTMIIYADDVDYTLQYYMDGNNFLKDKERFMLRRDNDSILISFISGIDMTLKVTFKSLEIDLTLPFAFQNRTRGLLGNFDGSNSNDYVLPNGTTLSPILTERELFHFFGSAWAVTEKNSVLRYGTKEGPANYSHPEFTPIFLDEQPNDTKKAAEDLCGVRNVACVYDYIATKSAAFANATKKTAAAAEITIKARKNTIPMLRVNSTLRMNSGETLTFNLNGNDPDPGDNITYYMVGNAENDVVHLDTHTGEVRFKANLSHLVSLSFYAVDSANMYSPITEIYIIICSRCSSHGTCDFDHALISDVIPNVQIATCICNPGWSGPDCSDDYNACAERPCSAQQNCTDLTPREQGNNSVGFLCSGCFPGYRTDVRDLTRCLDVDECSSNSTNKCTALCWNTPGSYTCGCNFGYILNEDGVSCGDMNECHEHLDNCEQTCENNEGGYTCSCYQGYRLSGVQGHCEQSPSSNDPCIRAGCSQDCSVNTSASGISIPICFCRAGYEIDPNNTKLCIDKDECQDLICSQSCRNTIGSFVCTCYPGNELSSDQRTCVPCDQLQYGPDCFLTCECNGRGVECNPISGCVCQTGWTGSHCESDIDECEENDKSCPIGQICTNTNGSFSCSCPVGYVKHDGACIDIDECSAYSILNTCDRLEVCVNLPGGFNCECKTGYSQSEGICNDIDECATSSVVCEQQCENVLGTYNCHCHYGYRLASDRTSCLKVADVCAEFEGLHCEYGCTVNDTERAVCFCSTGYKLAANHQNCTDINECDTRICSHNCTNTLGGFYCSCPIGMKLDNNKMNCSVCPPGSYGFNCSHNCACGAGSLRCDAKLGCICTTGWSGDKCDHDVDECDDPKVLQECRNKTAECTNFPGGYNCRCSVGYQQIGNATCQDIDECTSSPCHHICENSPGSYRCLCQKGFTLNATTQICEDVNECAIPGTHACEQQCDNIAGSYRCSCNRVGFVLENDGVSCKAMSNCSILTCPTINGGCSQERCFCNSGYQLNKTTMACDLIDIDWCANGTCEQTCTETEDGRSFRCGCTDGYLLNSDRLTCRDCPAGRYGKDCRENCTCITSNTVTCNTVNGTCSCKVGWAGVTCETDVDECNDQCLLPASCTNTPGSYICSCGRGYTKIQGICQDINECEGTHTCTHICSNVEGSYRCTCNQGYIISTDNVTCVDINECNGSNQCTHKCDNVEGSYLCSCPGSHVLDSDNVTCIEIARLNFELKLDISERLDLTNEATNRTLLEEGKIQLSGYFLHRASGILDIEIVSIRVGSLIFEAAAIVPKASQQQSALDFVMALSKLSGTNLTIGIYTGLASVAVKTPEGRLVNVNETTTLCEVFAAISSCSDNQECSEIERQISCKNIQTEDNSSNLVIILSIAIPAVIILIIVFIACVYCKRKKDSQYLGQESEDNNFKLRTFKE